MYRSPITQNVSDLDFDFSRSLNVKSNGAGVLPIYEFRLESNSNHMSIFHCLAFSTAQKFVFYLFIFMPKFQNPSTHPYPRGIFFRGTEGRLPWKIKLAGWIIFQIFCIQAHTHTHAHTHRHKQSNRPCLAKLGRGFMTQLDSLLHL